MRASAFSVFILSMISSTGVSELSDGPPYGNDTYPHFICKLVPEKLLRVAPRRYF